jgi:hypothetical protein
MTMLTALGVGYVVLLLLVLVYIKRRLGFYVTGRSALLGWMWVVCGPPHVYYWLAGKLSETVFVRITVSFSLMWIAFLLGIELTRLATPRQFRRADRVAELWRFMSVDPGYISKFRLAALASVSLVFMLWVAISEHQVGNLIRFIKLQGQTYDVAVFRGTIGGSRLYVYNVFLAAIAPFLAMMLLMMPAPRLVLYTWLRRVFILATVLGKITLFNRSALGLFIVELVIVKALLRDNRVQLKRVMSGVLLVLLMVLPAFYHYRSDIGAIVSYFFDRISLALYYGMIPYFQYFPDVAPHAMGRNIRVINWIVYHGAEYVPPMLVFAQEAGNYYGSFNAGFVAEAWADFGYAGVFVTSAILGVSAALADLVICGDGVKTREAAAVTVCVVYGVLQASSTAAQTALFSGGLALIPLLAAFLKMTRPAARRVPPPGDVPQPLTESAASS